MQKIRGLTILLNITPSLGQSRIDPRPTQLFTCIHSSLKASMDSLADHAALKLGPMRLLTGWANFINSSTYRNDATSSQSNRGIA